MVIMRNRLYIYTLVLLAFSGLTFHGCAGKPSGDNKVLAKVSNKAITLKEFKYRISKLPPYYQGMVNRNKKKFLDETIIEMMFYEEAIRKGIDRDKEVREVLAEAKKKIMIAKLLKNEIEDKLKADDAEVRQYYEAHKDSFKSPELRRASHILVGTEQEAKDIQAELSKGASFEELAKSKSIDATASRGGDVGYFREGQLVSEFENACKALKPGETSPIVHSQFGYHIIKLTDQKGPGVEPYEKVKAKIEDQLKKRNRSELFDKMVLDLKNKYNVEIEDDVFKSLEALDTEKKAK
jgi:peptidyl-prolyl cis-trans isomerase C